MEHLTVTLETAKKLKEAGFPQETALLWADLNDSQPWVWDGRTKGVSTGDYRDLGENGTDWIAAPTAQELADQLPEGCYMRRLNVASHDNYDGNGYQANCPGDTMAEALAQLWLKLNDERTNHAN